MKGLFDIKDNVTVITGGTGILGRTIAQYLAQEGAKVIILGRKEEVGREIADNICKAGGICDFMKTDVMNQEMLQQNCDDILAKYGRIDTLLNAAGGNMAGATIGPDQNFFDLSPEAFNKVLQLNLTGTVIPTQIFLRPMAEQNRSLLTNPDGSYTERGEEVIRQTPFGRMGQPEELCGTIHYLMSEAARFVTGTVAVVDGGFNVYSM